MSNLIRWEPARDIMSLREAMDHLFDEAFTHPFDGNGRWGRPAIDLYQTEDNVVVKAAIPGIKADEVQINVTGDVLTITGEVKEKSEVKDKTYHIREQRWDSFERSLPLPTEVKSDEAKAEFEDGVLTVTLPKAEKARPRTITIKAK